MKTKRILIYSGSAVLFCCLFVAKHSVLWSISLCALPLAVAFWLIIDQYPIILGLKTKVIKKSMILVTGVGITAYAAWLLEYAYGGDRDFLVQGSLAMALGIFILFNLALAHYRRH